MIQSILLFAFGFLCAGFLSLMIAPAIWRRAVSMTRKRVEASAPLTLNEIQADKDRIRAEFAMSTRRLEMSVKSFREKAAAQIVEIGRGRAELMQLTAERAEKNRAISELETQGGELRAELRKREDQLQALAETLSEADRALEKRAIELEKLGQLYDDASFSSSSRQIELVARESELETFVGDVSMLTAQRNEADKRAQEMALESRMAREALTNEKNKVGELETKVDRIMSTLADREETLARRERELAQLRERQSVQATLENDLHSQLTTAQADRVKLEAEIADLTLRMSTLTSGASANDVDLASLSADRSLLEERLTAMTAENSKLKADAAAHQRLVSEDWTDERRESALLREQMNGLAAEVIHLTSMLDGPDSPIARALGAPATASGASERPTSLADRVRALQQAASAGRLPVAGEMVQGDR